MKPNFSMILSSEGLSLLHRTYSGWAPVGDVAFDAPDLPGAMTALQERASNLPGDATCKLVIPDDQIKYLSLETSGDPDEAVRGALEGATPYAVDDLEYDWTAEGGTIRVAAVAIETLGEAEDFAVQHGFKPVSFAAMPADGAFGGEPFFGATRWAADNLPKGTKIERDTVPTRITGDAEMPGSDTPEGDAEEIDAEDDDAPVAAAAAKAVAEAGPAPRKQAPAKTDQGDPSKEAPATAAPRPATAPVSAKPKTLSATPADVPSAPPATSPAAAPSTVAPAAPAAFTSIRASRTLEVPAKSSGNSLARSSDQPPLVSGEERLSRLGGADPAAKSGDASAQNDAAPSLPSPASDGVTDPALMAELAASLRPDPEARLDRDAQADPTDPAAPEMPPATGAALPGLFGSRAPKEAAPAKPKGAPSRNRHDEKQRMTVFGARQNDVRGKPRFLGLILTAILLLFLVGVAAWASVFLDDGLARLFRGSESRQADVPAASEIENDPITQESNEAAPALIAPLPSGDAEDSDEPRIAALPEDNSPRPEVAALPDNPMPLSPNEALTRYAATGIWQMAPAPPETPGAGAPITDLYEVSLDPGIDLGLPATLPRRTPDARDTAPEKPSDPPPAGVRFDFDDRGFVRATPDGAMTPEGVRVFAGRPSLTPPAEMPQTVPVVAEIPVLEAEEGIAAETETIIFTGDPALAAIRPRARPESALAGETGTEEESDAGQLPDLPGTRVTEADTDTGLADTDTGLASNPSLAALRPQPRPQDMTAAAATLQTASAASTEPLVDGAALNRAIAAASAEPEASSDAEELAEAAFENATPQAVTASLTPLHRPGDFETIVKRTQTEAAAQPVPQAERMQVSLPSSATVASQATEKDVLNLRDVNLIGVYGSASNRRALVRLSNGRYAKVRVGDRLDGGQVAAIGEGELRYIKRGRNVVLKMPQG